MKSKVFQLSHGTKNIHRGKFYQWHILKKMVFGAATFSRLWVVTFQTKWKNVCCTLICLSVHCISTGKNTKQILHVSVKFSFLYVYIWFAVIKFKFIVKNNNLKCWLCFHLFLWRTQKKFRLKFRSPLSKTFIDLK